MVLKQPDGSSIVIDKDEFLVGSATDSDLRLQYSNVQEQHAKLERRSGRLFCTALAGDEDDLLADSYTWLNDSQCRPGVNYMVAPGAQIAFGDQGQAFTAQFEEVSGNSAMLEMLMKGLASRGSEEVRKRFESQ